MMIEPSSSNLGYDFDSKHKIADETTPCNGYMSGHYKRSYAYYTLHSRLPVILKDVVETLRRDKREIEEEYGKNSRQELELINGMLAHLINDLQTNHPFRHFDGDEPDREEWNTFIEQLPEEQNTPYTTCWLYAECYIYRRLNSILENSIYLKKYDFFGSTKKFTLARCIEDIHSLTEYTRRLDKSKQIFEELVKIVMWSNNSDFSDELQTENKKVLDDIDSMDDYILLNRIDDVWRCLMAPPLSVNKSNIVDIVCGSVGYELFTCLILAEYIIEKSLASKVRFHLKAHPWFVNEATQRDFNYTLEYLSEHSCYLVRLLAKKFIQFKNEGKFELAPVSNFWTGPHGYYMMRELAPELYEFLSKCKLIIFQGTLNYRKLLGDVCWDPTLEFQLCVRGFLPSNYCALSTLRAELVCGLPRGLHKKLTTLDPTWMINGHYGTIQFADCTREFGY